MPWANGLRNVQLPLDLSGVQVATHAIGDRGNRMALDAYAKVLGRDVDSDHRWRIEHAQHINAADIPRFGQLGVIAAMQGIHATSDAPYVLARLGPKRAEEGAYVWQKLMKTGPRSCMMPSRETSPTSFYTLNTKGFGFIMIFIRHFGEIQKRSCKKKVIAHLNQ